TVEWEESEEVLSRGFQVWGVGGEEIGKMLGKVGRLDGNVACMCFCKGKGVVEFKRRGRERGVVEIGWGKDGGF
ncbi:hypothetical protein, partial [Neisseria sicca]|uniref:hypothetical protein n=1 Tax=Neisseria sicca TaxID=490 RepID=UPI001C994952